MVLPFMIDASGLNGRIVRLGPMVDEILRAHDYPDPVKTMLGEVLALGAGLAAALKYDGIFTLQIKGNGPVPMLVADLTSDGAMRGYAQVKGDLPPTDEIAKAPILRLFGTGYLAFTVDQGPDMERYQGIVALEGATLEDCIQHYFQQSEQFASGVRLAASRNDQGQWRAAALFVQRLPDEGLEIDKDDHEENWHRAITFLSSAEDKELLSADLSAHDLLYRLFHEDGVRVFDTRQLRFECRCSREKLENALITLSDDDITHALQDGKVTSTCEFCNKLYEFSEDELKALRNS
jgi:molecular chaperone Hsp33